MVGKSQANTLSQAQPIIELLHVWSTENELAALAAFKEATIADGASWSDYSIGNNMVGLQAEFTERVAIGAPPNIVQWILSTEMKVLVENGVFRLVEDKNQFYKKNLLPEIYELIKMDGGLSGIPVGIHIQNHIAYNTDLLDRFNLSQAESWEQLIGYGDLLAEKGIRLIAVSDYPWQLRTLFISILSSILTADEFQTFQSETLPLIQLRDKIEKALEIFFALKQYSNNDSYNLHWQKATMIVDEGKALVQVLGDFIAPEFSHTNISCDLTPQANYPIWGVDSIALVNTDDTNLLAGQELLIEKINKPDVISNYINRKGGLPALTNIKAINMSDCASAVNEKWIAANQRVWIGGDHWLKRLAVLGEMLNQFWQNSSADAKSSSQRLVDTMVLY